MNEAATAFIPPQQESEQVYRGLSFEVEAIIDAEGQVEASCRLLKIAFRSRQTTDVQKIAADIARVTRQIHILSSHLSSVCERHIQRREKP